ncbi:MAG: 4Fe-4S dicluster domain-containing protein [SAR324 cluster bacterium]|nr:4Fe-4S dicluster domain-containing protein [SAR324 cluster bacterium]
MTDKKAAPISRRNFFKKAGTAGAAIASGTTALAVASDVLEGEAYSDALKEYFQKHYRDMSKDEVKAALARIERKAKRKHGVDITVENTAPYAREDTVFGYALNISKCKGYRKCVYACVEENNLSRDPEIHYIRVLEMEKGSMDLEKSNHYFGEDPVPKAGKFYLPVQCQHCEDPPCVKACPTQATWSEPDGIVVIDYNWCIGCHYCVIACPYWARHFNWEEPVIPKEEINTETHYLGNRPRERGVMEKCTFCIQRTRKGKMPACLEACPTGARVFGNLLDPKSEIRYILENKTVFRLKEELNTEPKFWYYTD